jgi:hypothetical protein
MLARRTHAASRGSMSNRRRNSPSPACTNSSSRPPRRARLATGTRQSQGGLTSNWRPRSRRPLGGDGRARVADRGAGEGRGPRRAAVHPSEATRNSHLTYGSRKRSYPTIVLGRVRAGHADTGAPTSSPRRRGRKCRAKKAVESAAPRLRRSGWRQGRSRSPGESAHLPPRRLPIRIRTANTRPGGRPPSWHAPNGHP